MSYRSAIIKDRLLECIHNNEINNSDLVQIFEHVAIILNVQTITNYAKSEKISYNGALKRKVHKTVIDGQTFIINND
jgi:hypothetical protein